MAAFYQACFTRAEAGNLAAGWQTVNLSPDAPASVGTFFESSEKTNDVSVSKTNADGSPLRITKVICDDRHVGMAKVQYGLSDSSGRARFFSHGFVFKDPYEILKTPETVLGIAEENFRFTMDETATPPASLVYREPPEESALLQKYGLDREKCVTFMKCALFPLFSSNQTTVFIRTNGSAEMAIDLLYLIYYALPYSLRPRVTASTYAKPTGTNSMYVFTDELPAMGSHVDPLTGENNILTEVFEKKLARYPFALRYAGAMPLGAEKRKLYYDLFEKILGDMGDVHLNKMEALRLAYRSFSSQAVKDEDLPGVLYDWLALPTPLTASGIRHVEEFLAAVTAKKLTLSENTVQLLQTQIGKTGSESLRNGYLRYEAQALTAGGSGSFAKMTAWRRDPVMFAGLNATLRQTPEGTAYLNAYSLAFANELSNASCTYNMILDFFKNCDGLLEREKIKGILTEKCERIAKSELDKGVHFRKAFAAYEEARKALDPKAAIDWNPLTDAVDIAFRNAFDVRRLEEYKEFYGQYGKTYIWGQDFFSVWNSGDFRRMTSYASHNCQRKEYYELYDEDVKALASYMFKHALDLGAAEKVNEMSFWVHYARLHEEKLSDFLLNHRAAVLCDPGKLAEALDSDPYFQKEENVSKLFDECDIFYDENESQTVLSKASLKLLRDRLKEFGKEKKNSEKAAKKEDRTESKFVSFLKGFGKRKDGESEDEDDAPEKPSKKRK